jgi:hypothetical protein
LPATNNFSSTDAAILAPYTDAVAITPSNTVDLAQVTRALHAHGAGSHHDVAVTLANDPDGTSVVLSIAKGDVLPIRVKRVWVTGTTATTIVGLY